MNRSTDQPVNRSTGFTLVELLVVVAIIIAILAILLPSTRRAWRAARLTVCASNLHQTGLAVVNYAIDSLGAYPYRKVEMWSSNPRKGKLKSFDYDDRPFLNTVFPIDKLTCPLASPRTWHYDTVAKQDIHWSYEMYFGSAIVRSDPTTFMLRVTDRPRWQGFAINILAADVEWDYLAPVWGLYSTHRDESDMLQPFPAVHATHAMVTWENFAYTRGQIDRNFLYNDLSVSYMNHIVIQDPREMRVPSRCDPANWTQGIYNYVPIERP